MGSGTWHQTSGENPITEPGELLATLGFGGECYKHPYLLKTHEVDAGGNAGSEEKVEREGEKRVMKEVDTRATEHVEHVEHVRRLG